MSTGFQFEYKAPSPADNQQGRTSRTRRGSGARRANQGWAKWLAVCWAGFLSAAYMAWQAEDIRRFGDSNSLLAIGAILVVILPVFLGFTFFRLKKLRADREWIELWWKPTLMAGLALIGSLIVTLWCGYLIAERLARDWTF